MGLVRSGLDDGSNALRGMNDALTKLVEWISSFLESAKFWAVMTAFQEGVVLRLGKYHRTIGPGLHWVVPFVDAVEEVVIVPMTITLPTQTITLKDGKIVVAKAMVKCKVFDSKGYSLEVYDAKDAVSDTSCGVIFETLRKMTLEEAIAADLSSAVTVSVRREVKKWFISILAVTFTDFGEVRTIRLINEGQLLG